MLYRRLGSFNSIEGHAGGELCTWQNDELRVVEQPPASGTDDEPADAATHPAAVQAWKMCFQRALASVEACEHAKDAAQNLRDAIAELCELAQEQLDFGAASTELADAMDKA